MVKLKNDGKIVWERRIHSLINEVPTGIKVGDDGAIYVTYVQDIGGSASMYTVEKYTEHTADSSLLYNASSEPVCKKNELIVRFKAGTLNTQAIDNTIGSSIIEFGSLDYFLKSSTYSIIQNALSDICVSGSALSSTSCPIYVTKVYPNLKTTYTSTINRLGEVVPVPDYWTTLLLEFPDGMDIKDVKTRLDTLNGIIAYCEPNMILHMFSNPPNDSRYATLQHSLHKVTGSIYNNADINIEPAWDIETGKSFVKVGVVDEDGCWQHQDFGYDLINPSSSKLNGWNLLTNQDIHNDPPNLPGSGNHGTQCLSVIGAIRDNGLGISGIAGGSYTGVGNLNDDGVSLYCLKVNLSPTNYPTLSIAANAIYFSSIYDQNNTDYRYGLNLENLSWGITPQYITSNGMAIDQACKTLGLAVKGASRNMVTLVASRGNADPDASAPVWPACFEDDWVVNVAGTGTDGNYATVSNSTVETSYGNNVDIAAPCSNPLSQSMMGTMDYWTFAGTSCSAPHVAGVIGLLMSYLDNPAGTSDYNNLAPEDCEEIIQLSATNNNSGSAKPDIYSGFGRLNAGKALQIVQKPSNKIYHFGNDPSANCTVSNLGFNNIATGHDIELNELYQNDAGDWFQPGAGLYKVSVYKLDFQLNYTLASNEIVTNFWARNSSSNTFPLFTGVQNTLIPHEKLSISACSATQATMYGYVYEVFDYTSGAPLGWWPKQPIGAPPSNIRFEISILAHNQTAWPNGISSYEFNSANVSVYPNPASNIQKIELDLSSESNVSIELLDVSGRIISNVFKGSCSKGHTVIFSDLKDIADGVYVYSIHVGEKSRNIRIIKKDIKN